MNVCLLCWNVAERLGSREILLQRHTKYLESFISRMANYQNKYQLWARARAPSQHTQTRLATTLPWKCIARQQSKRIYDQIIHVIYHIMILINFRFAHNQNVLNCVISHPINASSNSIRAGWKSSMYVCLNELKQIKIWRQRFSVASAFLCIAI